MKRERSFIHVNTRLIYQVVNLNKSTIKLYTESGINMAYILGGQDDYSLMRISNQSTNSMLKLPTIKLSQNLGIQETTYIVAWIAKFSLNQFYYPPCSHMPYIAGVQGSVANVW